MFILNLNCVYNIGYLHLLKRKYKIYIAVTIINNKRNIALNLIIEQISEKLSN